MGQTKIQIKAPTDDLGHHKSDDKSPLYNLHQSTDTGAFFVTDGQL